MSKPFQIDAHKSEDKNDEFYSQTTSLFCQGFDRMFEYYKELIKPKPMEYELIEIKLHDKILLKHAKGKRYPVIICPECEGLTQGIFCLDQFCCKCGKNFGDMLARRL